MPSESVRAGVEEGWLADIMVTDSSGSTDQETTTGIVAASLAAGTCLWLNDSHITLGLEDSWGKEKVFERKETLAPHWLLSVKGVNQLNEAKQLDTNHILQCHQYHRQGRKTLKHSEGRAVNPIQPPRPAITRRLACGCDCGNQLRLTRLWPWSNLKARWKRSSREKWGTSSNNIW